MRLMVTDFIDISENAKAKLRGLGAIIHEDVPEEADLIERVKDAEIITANYVSISKRIIDAAPDLKYIVVPAVGYEWVDHVYAAEKKIKVLNCPTHNGRAVAEYAIGLMFAVQRKLIDASHNLKSGKWEPKQFKGHELNGSKLGIIGFGNIGKAIAAMAEGMGMSVAAVNSKSSKDEWATVMRSSDIICACLPQNSGTRRILDREKLAMVKPSAIIINVGRGSTIDLGELLTALKEQRVAGVGLDVYENEPLSGKPSDYIVELANLPSVVATAHTAYNTHQSVLRLSDELLGNIESCMIHSPINTVN